MKTGELFDLGGKVAIVSGGYGLYGKHISTGLCEAGASVVIASRNVEKCAELADELNARGYDAVGMKLDLGSVESINGFVADVLEKYGRIDVLVNNAVIRQGMADLEDVSAEGWNFAANINSTGLMQISKQVVKSMKERKSGCIINISSIQGAVGPNFEVYGSTGMSSPVNYTYDKWGMIGLTKWMANYYGKYNIRVNCISPGGYNPDAFADESKREFVDNYLRLTPLQRFADDDDIKGPIVFLASQAAKYVTGHNLMVDGGWTNW
ncbi:MAG: SDR family oxidoreductase [Clostridia bacterium]|jgi:NAD(P)-dependent dehydrogenase (short-subunit alcohol dehydrogenase family)|nr:SDR family oxidoreductase [Clostridia bacterium]MBT7122283.1 SDR family oxidoreductase [Clostridia bacterium]